MPHAERLYTVEELVRLNDHARRPRLNRFWRVAGPITTAQTLLVAIIYSLILLAALASGDYLFAAGSLILPAVAAYVARPLLIRNPQLTGRLMNVAAAASMVYALLIHDPKAPSIPPVAYLALGYVSFHISAIFWLLSDPSIFQPRKRWWHR